MPCAVSWLLGLGWCRANQWTTDFVITHPQFKHCTVDQSHTLDPATFGRTTRHKSGLPPSCLPIPWIQCISWTTLAFLCSEQYFCGKCSQVSAQEFCPQPHIWQTHAVLGCWGPEPSPASVPAAATVLLYLFFIAQISRFLFILCLRVLFDDHMVSESA